MTYFCAGSMVVRKYEPAQLGAPIGAYSDVCLGSRRWVSRLTTE